MLLIPPLQEEHPTPRRALLPCPLVPFPEPAGEANELLPHCSRVHSRRTNARPVLGLQRRGSDPSPSLHPNHQIHPPDGQVRWTSYGPTMVNLSTG